MGYSDNNKVDFTRITFNVNNSPDMTLIINKVGRRWNVLYDEGIILSCCGYVEHSDDIFNVIDDAVELFEKKRGN